MDKRLSSSPEDTSATEATEAVDDRTKVSSSGALELRIEVLSRPGCELCEEMIAELEFYLARTPFDFNVRDIDDDQQLIDKYGLDIPVLMINGQQISRHAFSRTDLDRELSKVG